jgi:hypothetical protein
MRFTPNGGHAVRRRAPSESGGLKSYGGQHAYRRVPAVCSCRGLPSSRRLLVRRRLWSPTAGGCRARSSTSTKTSRRLAFSLHTYKVCRAGPDRRTPALGQIGLAYPSRCDLDNDRLARVPAALSTRMFVGFVFAVLFARAAVGVVRRISCNCRVEAGLSSAIAEHRRAAAHPPRRGILDRNASRP